MGWFRSWDGNSLSWERLDDSVSDRNIRTFLVTSGLATLRIRAMNWIQQHSDLAPQQGNRGSPVLSLLLSPGKSTGAAYWRVKFILIVGPLIEMALDENSLNEPGSRQLAVTKNSNQPMPTITFIATAHPKVFGAYGA